MSLQYSMQEALRRVIEGTKHYRSKCVAHFFEQGRFLELKGLSGKISEVTGNVAAKVAQICSQLRPVQEKILALESLLAPKKARWEIAARMSFEMSCTELEKKSQL